MIQYLLQERENVETKKEAKKKWKEKKKKTVEEKKKKTIKGTVSGQGSLPQPEHLGKVDILNLSSASNAD